MSDDLYCYWCGHTPVLLQAPCPRCNEHLSEIVPPGMGDGLLGPIHVRAWKEILQEKDREITNLLRAIGT